MEILKKDILKEMEKKSQENLDKGIDIAVSILKNEFPFVTGWKYKDDPNFFNSTVYIMLICDMDKSSEFYNSPIKDYYKNLEADVTYPFSPLEMSIEMDNDEKYELYKEIQKSLDETYYEIPNDYRHTFKSYGSNTDQPKEIYIDGFVFPAPEKLSESDPKVGTGKKPKDSDRRLYTDENPSDTVSVKFKTKQDIIDTLNKESFKSKSHARQSQIINLIHQRLRVTLERAKDPEVKKRLKTAFEYIESKKEASKRKTEEMKEGEITERCWKGYTQKGMKTMFGKRYPNCVKIKKK